VPRRVRGLKDNQQRVAVLRLEHVLELREPPDASLQEARSVTLLDDFPREALA